MLTWITPAPGSASLAKVPRSRSMIRPAPCGPRSVTTHVTEAPVESRVTVTTVPFGIDGMGALARAVVVPAGAARLPVGGRRRGGRRRGRRATSSWSAGAFTTVGSAGARRGRRTLGRGRGRLASSRVGASVADRRRGVGASAAVRAVGRRVDRVGADRSDRARPGRRFAGRCRWRGPAAPPPSARRRTTGDVVGRRTAAAPHLLGPPELRPSLWGSVGWGSGGQAIASTLRAS